MLEDDFKFEYLKRKQLTRIVDVYNLDIDKSLPRKKMLELINDKLEIQNDGTIVHKEDKEKTKDELKGTGKYDNNLFTIKLTFL